MITLVTNGFARSQASAICATDTCRELAIGHRGVHIGRVDKVDSGINGKLDLFVDGVLLQVADQFINTLIAAICHGAQAQFRNIQAGWPQ